MSRKKHKRRVFHDGDPCDRRKPCPGVFRLETERNAPTVILKTWRCDTCGRKRPEMINKLNGGQHG